MIWFEVFCFVGLLGIVVVFDFDSVDVEEFFLVGVVVFEKF